MTSLADEQDPLVPLKAQEQLSTSKSCIRRHRCLCCCCISITAILIIGVLVGIAGYYCCNLWLVYPEVKEFDSTSVRPASVTLDAKSFAFVFTSTGSIVISNANSIGATFHTSRVHAWIWDTSIVPGKDAVYLGEGDLKQTLDLKPRRDTTAELDISFVITLESSSVAPAVINQCLQQPPRLELLMNLTDVLATVLIFPLSLNNIVFNTTVNNCTVL
eukprot:m.6375 g.6375  ORF g.6375 m.6375 type:complete len:217 (-) comp3523_c0_seq1:72-722(-)